ncbi:unnamed protein product [Amoebophrya sp. A120]|nr:unnamed protein product [Amoebophrya sp. A120]|eukprot:GSA120T00004780001.1
MAQAPYPAAPYLPTGEEEKWSVWLSPRPGKWQDLIRRAVALEETRTNETALKRNRKSRTQHRQLQEHPAAPLLSTVKWGFVDTLTPTFPPSGLISTASTPVDHDNTPQDDRSLSPDSSPSRRRNKNGNRTNNGINRVCFILQQSEFLPVLEEAGGGCWITRYPGMAEMCAKVNMARYFRRLGDQLLALEPAPRGPSALKSKRIGNTTSGTLEAAVAGRPGGVAVDGETTNEAADGIGDEDEDPDLLSGDEDHDADHVQQASPDVDASAAPFAAFYNDDNADVLSGDNQNPIGEDLDQEQNDESEEDNQEAPGWSTRSPLDATTSANMQTTFYEDEVKMMGGTASNFKKKKKRKGKKKKNKVQKAVGLLKSITSFQEPSESSLLEQPSHLTSSAAMQLDAAFGIVRNNPEQKAAKQNKVRLPPLPSLNPSPTDVDVATSTSGKTSSVTEVNAAATLSPVNREVKKRLYQNETAAGAQSGPSGTNLMSRTCAALVSPKRNRLPRQVGAAVEEGEILTQTKDFARVDPEAGDDSTQKITFDDNLSSSAMLARNKTPVLLTNSNFPTRPGQYSQQNTNPLNKLFANLTRDNFHANISTPTEQATNYLRRPFVLHEHIPKTWVYPEDRPLVEKFLEDNPTKTLICKPEDSSQGQGIFLLSRMRDLQVRSVSRSNLVLQEYLDNPLLLNGYKFDMRVYVVMSGFGKNFKIFVGREALCRFCTKKYQPFGDQCASGSTAGANNVVGNSPTHRLIDEHSDELARHLCNYSIQKKCDGYVRAGEQPQQPVGVVPASPTAVATENVDTDAAQGMAEANDGTSDATPAEVDEIKQGRTHLTTVRTTDVQISGADVREKDAGEHQVGHAAVEPPNDATVPDETPGTKSNSAAESEDPSEISRDNIIKRTNNARTPFTDHFPEAPEGSTTEDDKVNTASFYTLTDDDPDRYDPHEIMEEINSFPANAPQIHDLHAPVDRPPSRNAFAANPGARNRTTTIAMQDFAKKQRDERERLRQRAETVAGAAASTAANGVGVNQLGIAVRSPKDKWNAKFGNMNRSQDNELEVQQLRTNNFKSTFSPPSTLGAAAGGNTTSALSCNLSVGTASPSQGATSDQPHKWTRTASGNIVARSSEARQNGSFEKQASSTLADRKFVRKHGTTSSLFSSPSGGTNNSSSNSSSPTQVGVFCLDDLNNNTGNARQSKWKASETITAGNGMMGGSPGGGATASGSSPNSLHGKNRSQHMKPDYSGWLREVEALEKQCTKQLARNGRAEIVGAGSKHSGIYSGAELQQQRGGIHLFAPERASSNGVCSSTSEEEVQIDDGTGEVAVVHTDKKFSAGLEEEDDDLIATPCSPVVQKPKVVDVDVKNHQRKNLCGTSAAPTSDRNCKVPPATSGAKKLDTSGAPAAAGSDPGATMSFEALSSDPLASKRLLSVVLSQIEQEFPDTFNREKFYEQLSDICGQWAEAVHPYLLATYRPFSCDKNAKHRSFYEKNEARCAQLLGFDLMLDADMKMHLLEVNSGPSLNMDDVIPVEYSELPNGEPDYRCFCGEHPLPHRHVPSPIDRFVKTNVMSGLFQVIRSTEQSLQQHGKVDSRRGVSTSTAETQLHSTNVMSKINSHGRNNSSYLTNHRPELFRKEPFIEIERDYRFRSLLRKFEMWFSCKVNNTYEGMSQSASYQTSSFQLRRAFAKLKSLDTSDLDLEYTKMKREFVQPYVKSPWLHARFEILDLVPVLQAIKAKKRFRSVERLLECLLGGNSGRGK